MFPQYIISSHINIKQGLFEQRSIIQEANSDIVNMVSSLEAQGQDVSTQWRQNIEMNTRLELQAQHQLGNLVLKQEDLFSRLEESLVLAQTSNREQRQAWIGLRNGTTSLHEAFGGLNSLVSETTAALDGVSAYVGILAMLAGSFRSWASWAALAAAVVVSLIIGLTFFGLRGLATTSSESNVRFKQIAHTDLRQ